MDRCNHLPREKIVDLAGKNMTRQLRKLSVLDIRGFLNKLLVTQTPSLPFLSKIARGRRILKASKMFDL
jgi:hypothetical protein